MTLIFTGYHICVYICDPSEKTSKQNSAKKNSAKKYPIVKKNAPKSHNTVITKEKKIPLQKRAIWTQLLKFPSKKNPVTKTSFCKRGKIETKMLFSYRCLSDYNFVLQLFSHPNAKPAQYSKLFIQMNLLFLSLQLLASQGKWPPLYECHKGFLVHLQTAIKS